MKPFQAGLPNAHGVLPQGQNFFFLSPPLLKVGDLEIFRAAGPATLGDSTRHGNADSRAGMLVSATLCGSFLLSALSSPHLGTRGVD